MSTLREYKLTNTSTSTSRYKKLSRLVDSEGYEYIESPEDIVIPESPKDYFHEVTSADEGRLDLISFKYYKTPMLWWVIAKSSDITNPFNVPIGTVLRIPDIHTLYGERGVL